MGDDLVLIDNFCGVFQGRDDVFRGQLRVA